MSKGVEVRAGRVLGDAERARIRNGRVTAGKIQQLEGSDLVTHYVAKLGGKIIARRGREWRFKTPEEARAFGREMRAALASTPTETR